MYDLPSQALLQQCNARAVGGEELEVLGKKASALYLCRGLTMNDAVVETVKKAGLSPEQVRRVVEFANTDAYLKEFEKKGSTHKYISFEGGPANPAEVLKDLNDGGGGTIFDRGDGDYSQPPMVKAASDLYQVNRRAMEKVAGLGFDQITASVVFDPAETAFRDMWRVEDRPLPYANPLEDALDVKEKLSSVDDELRHEIDVAESAFTQCSEDLYNGVKSAVFDGVKLGHVVQAWQAVVPGNGFVKTAFTFIGPRLVEEGVLPSLDALGSSLEKTAGVAVVNDSHPLVQNFSYFCSTLEKLAQLREARRETSRELAGVMQFLKTAGSGGIVGSAWRGAGALGEKIAPVVGSAGRALGGDTAGEVAQAVAKRAPRAALAAGGLVLGREGYDRAVRYGPLNEPVAYAKSLRQGTPEWYAREQQLASNPGLF